MKLAVLLSATVTSGWKNRYPRGTAHTSTIAVRRRAVRDRPRAPPSITRGFSPPRRSHATPGPDHGGIQALSRERAGTKPIDSPTLTADTSAHPIVIILQSMNGN